MVYYIININNNNNIYQANNLRQFFEYLKSNLDTFKYLFQAMIYTSSCFKKNLPHIYNKNYSESEILFDLNHWHITKNDIFNLLTQYECWKFFHDIQGFNLEVKTFAIKFHKINEIINTIQETNVIDENMKEIYDLENKISLGMKLSRETFEKNFFDLYVYEFLERLNSQENTSQEDTSQEDTSKNLFGNKFTALLNYELLKIMKTQEFIEHIKREKFIIDKINEIWSIHKEIHYI
ncbi:hypothetical protein QLL95_gp0536 [Cotonvirus japonicus]|uniref:Uncharacterized protein n=1 Tax=Cotonvirus japonicus TaxID=2811091 RepID=A0ABM7NU49_9VIRU|nr:hypothetical protein QLL95_gp0536 [Cotonvirus japonicus]BCS83587.1 hypothetical protein [Cotonvirus japonicus]